MPVVADEPFVVWAAPELSAVPVVADEPFVVSAAPEVLVAPEVSAVAVTSVSAAAESDESAPAEFDSAGAGHVDFAPAVASPRAVAAATELSVVSQPHVAPAVVAADPAAERVAQPVGPALARLRPQVIQRPELLAAGAIAASADARCGLHEPPV